MLDVLRLPVIPRGFPPAGARKGHGHEVERHGGPLGRLRKQVRVAYNRHNVPMDAGGVAFVGAIAGVLGAAVGAGGAVASARVAGRQQGAQWRRQVRREAYAGFLVKALALYELLRGFQNRLLEAGVMQADLRGSLEDVERELRELNTARAVAALEGPGAVIAAGAKAHKALGEWLKEINHADDDRTLPEAALREREQAARISLEDAHSACRRALQA